jgi:hypothetical protein
MEQKIPKKLRPEKGAKKPLRSKSQQLPRNFRLSAARHVFLTRKTNNPAITPSPPPNVGTINK